MDSETSLQSLDIKAICELLPHRYPFLLIDRIEDLDPGETATGVKNVTMNEPFFQGHFPGEPVMPGVLILEAMAQTAGVIALTFLGEQAHGNAVYFMGIDKAKFRRRVVPGDQLHLKLVKKRGGGAVWKFDGQAFVGDELAAQGQLTAMLNSK